MRVRRTTAARAALLSMAAAATLMVAACVPAVSHSASAPASTPTPAVTPSPSRPFFPAGPPYPAAIPGQRVYDHAGIFSSGVIADAEASIGVIETRTGAQIAVYTQVKPQSNSLEAANADAAALMNQWGVGHAGVNDGLVILFDLDTSLQHGQVTLFAGAGFSGGIVSLAQLQTVFDEDMAPLLRQSPPDFNGALAIALADIDEATS